MEMTAPQLAASGFYESYLEYQNGLAGKSRTVKEAEAQDREATKTFFTAGFWRKQLALQKKCALSKDEVLPGCDSDPYYCAQEPPIRQTAHAGVVQGKKATVPVDLCFGTAAKCETRTVKVKLRKAGKKWLIDQIDCP